MCTWINVSGHVTWKMKYHYHYEYCSRKVLSRVGGLGFWTPLLQLFPDGTFIVSVISGSTCLLSTYILLLVFS